MSGSLSRINVGLFNIPDIRSKNKINIRLSSSLLISQKLDNFFGQQPKTSPEYTFVPKTSYSILQTPSPKSKSKSKQLTQQIFKTVTPIETPSPSFKLNLDVPTPPNIPPSVFVPSLDLNLKPKFSKSNVYNFKKSKQKKQYTPSATSLFFNIKKKVDTKKTYTGLNLRPVAI